MLRSVVCLSSKHVLCHAVPAHQQRQCSGARLLVCPGTRQNGIDELVYTFISVGASGFGDIGVDLSACERAVVGVY